MRGTRAEEVAAIHEFATGLNDDSRQVLLEIARSLHDAERIDFNRPPAEDYAARMHQSALDMAVCAAAETVRFRRMRDS